MKDVSFLTACLSSHPLSAEPRLLLLHPQHEPCLWSISRRVERESDCFASSLPNQTLEGKSLIWK